MKLSQLFFSTLREAPADAEIVSHQLLLRAGYIKQLAAGIYSYMPLGLRVLRNIEHIVREELNAAGAQELLMPVLQPAELWKQSGRYEVYGPELTRLTDRQEREFVLGPTHEEVITSIVSQEVSSYRQLPVTLYQIQTKFRDERRPRYGLLRTREFMMKDAYSFDVDWEGLEVSYQTMNAAYHRIFTALGLHFRAVEADSGAIGGEGGTHEFMALADVGEDIVAACNSCQYAANIEKAEAQQNQEQLMLLLQAQDNLQKTDSKGQKHWRKVHTPDIQTVEQLQQFFQVKADRIMKTMLFLVDGAPVAVVVRGDYEVHELKVKNYLMALNIERADASAVHSLFNSTPGFIGPIGLDIPVLVDYSVLDITDGIAGANEKDTHYTQLSALRDLPLTHVADFRHVVEGEGCPRCEAGVLQFHRGIELGHIFKLGKKYSDSLQATFLDRNGKAQQIIMGCYGIGISRILSALVEQYHSEQGIVLPIAVAPYKIHIIVIAYSDDVQRELAERLDKQLRQRGIEALIDDRDERAGVKFKDADLIGIPYRIIVGKDAAGNKVEWIDRMQDQREVIDVEVALQRLLHQLV